MKAEGTQMKLLVVPKVFSLEELKHGDIFKHHGYRYLLVKNSSEFTYTYVCIEPGGTFMHTYGSNHNATVQLIGKLMIAYDSS